MAAPADPLGGDPMLYVTDQALSALGAMRADSDASPDESILLYLEEDGTLGLAIAEIEEGDNVIERDGEVVVIVAEDLAQALEGMTLDVSVSDEGDEIEFIITESDEDDEAGLFVDDSFEADGNSPA
jgi:Fe-S cluster assembly iron-binding protein IscA